MGIRFVLGRSGSGKSRRVFEEIEEELRSAPDGPPLVLLVPEQMTQAADRVFANRFGGTIRLQSLSFRRLAFRVMQEVGGASRLHIDDTGKKMLLYKIARNRSEEFRAFRRLTEGSSWIDAVHDWYAECKRYVIGAEQLQRAAELPAVPPMLKDKLHDLSIMLESMEGELAGKYVDSEDDLALFSENVPSSRFIRGARIWVDGFHGFTPIEVTALRQICKYAQHVTFALTIDRDYAEGDQPDEMDLFHSTASTLIALKRTIADEGLAAEVTVLAEGGEERRSPVLVALEQAFVRKMNGQHPPPVNDAGSAVDVCAAANPRAEVESCARDIIRRVSSGAARWRDIAVFVRDWEGYGDLISSVFEDYGIPCFLDQKKAVSHHPFIELIRAALDVVLSRWSYDAVFRAVKTDLLIPHSAFDNEAEARYAMDKLENVVLEYGIKGSRWTENRRWRLNAVFSLEDEPTEQPSEELEAEEERVHHWRMLVAAPLRMLEQRLSKAVTMRDQAESLYRFLEETGAAESLHRWRISEERSGKPEKAKIHEQLWDRVLDVLDQLVELAGEEAADTELFAGMISAGLEGIRMGVIPPALDQVLVGNLDRTRTFGVKRLYLLGVNDGIFPMRPKDKGVISETERELLNDSGLELAPDSRRRLLDERFLFYRALALPTDGIWIGYALADAEGKAMLPSEWVSTVMQLAPESEVVFAPGDLPTEAGDDEALERLARPARAIGELSAQLRRWKNGGQISGVWWAVYNWLAERPYWRERLKKALVALEYTYCEEKLTKETALALYGKRMRSSVSRLERFAGCPFSHFAAYGLRLQERRLYRLEAPDIGQLYHAVLSRMAKRLTAEGRTWADLEKRECLEWAELAVEELAPRLLSEILFSSNRHKFLMNKMKAVVGRTASAIREQSVRSGFRQRAAELAFGEKKELPPLRLTLSEGGEMLLQGRIDRVDAAQNERGEWYIRVVDYKSRAHRLSLSDVYYGLSLQLLAYAEAAASSSKTWLGSETKTAGALYFHVHKPVLALSRPTDPGILESQLFKEYKMRGLLLDDAEAARMMDIWLERGTSPVVPLEWKKDGTLGARSQVTNAERWALLRSFVRRKLSELGNGISSGVIAVSPYRKKQETSCDYCQYKPVCGFDPLLTGSLFRWISPLADEEVWIRMEREGGEAP